jgi:hypothetical protein
MVVVNCSVPGCEFHTEDITEALAIAVLNNHGYAHTTAAPPPPAASGPKLDRPQVNVGISTEEWNVFVRRWNVFRTGSGISDASAPSQLFQCAGLELGDSILKASPNAPSGTTAQLLEVMRSLAVIPIATGVLRTELLQMRQERDEPFRAYAARVRGKAEACEFTARCVCGLNVDYTDHSIRDALLGGINDPDIRREVLGTANILRTPVNDVIGIIENKEMARNALPSSNLSAISSFTRQKNETPVRRNTENAPPVDRNKRSSCPDCKKMFNVFTEGPRGYNSRAHQYCIDCYRIRRRNRRQQHQGSSVNAATTAETNVSQIATFCVSEKQKGISWSNNIDGQGKWKETRPLDHPRVPIIVTIAPTKKGDNKITDNKAHVSAIADTGAQSDLWSLSEFIACGFSTDILSPARLDLLAANSSDISVEGVFHANIKTRFADKSSTSTNSMVYVSRSVNSMFLSYETLLKLKILPEGFPNSAAFAPKEEHEYNYTSNAIRALTNGCTNTFSDDNASCDCPQRSVVPKRPGALPFPCLAENNSKMKEWLLNRYKSSTFNTCPHRPLPCMEGPPVEIHIDESATPKTCHTPANIPLHWQQRVYDDLMRDEALNVIEPVPYGEPVTWCHRMVVTRKHDGTPRRTVDLSPLNKFCKRETFATETPFQLARRIPKGAWKTVTDAWNGYHSVPLRKSDRHLTTFITPFGRWRYTRAPQGFISSGDGYNRRFDEILAPFERKERCVDDTIHYDDDLEQHWWRTIDLLTRLGEAGIVLNPDKFQFAEKTVDFAGFRVSDSTIEPLPKYLDAIRDFPTPASTTDIRSWFGLVNQVTNYAQLRDTMAPFKPFLSPRHKFMWNDDLDQAFERSKQFIIEAIRHGVEIFDLQKRTCLRPDWSNKGIGYFLLQQWCNCPSETPGCCIDGWRITLAGSRFLSSAESRYAAVEGEALAVAWGLEQTRYFTQGCDNLVVVTDHKPLVKILGDRTLDEITNTRLFRLKQRTLPWRFIIKHLPGKTNFAADATSRHPSSSGSIAGISLDQGDIIEHAIIASVKNDSRNILTMPWNLIAKETSSDASLRHLSQLIEQGFTENDRNDDTVASIWPLRDSLYIQDGVILHQDRILVPQSLRQRVLNNLHAAHQGITAMEQRARAIVYWPGMTSDIRSKRESCGKCNRNAPSQAATPPIPSPAPSTPFESIYADFFDCGGRHYLVVGDRLSGWVEVYASPSGTHASGAAGLIKHLRSLFATFGVPEELSSDGGPEFTAKCTEDFLARWGIHHRISSAYFAQSNGRAEVAVKKAKRLLMSNTGPTGSLDNDGFLRAILQLRNTPDPDCNISPAQIIFGRPIRDEFSFMNKLEKFSNPNVRPLWREAWAAKEDALRTRMTRSTEKLTAHSRALRPLRIGEHVFLQNQTGPNANKWDKSGIVVDALDYDQFWVKVDGSGRLTRRNRRFLRSYTPTSTSLQPPENAVPLLTTADSNIARQTSDEHVKLPQLTFGPDLRSSTVGNERIWDAPTSPPEPEFSVYEDVTSNRTPAESPRSETEIVNTPRSRRAIRPPKRFEPETGTWVDRG